MFQLTDFYTVALPRFASGIVRATLSKKLPAQAPPVPAEQLLPTSRHDGPGRYWLLDVSEHQCPLLSLRQWLALAKAAQAGKLPEGPFCVACLVAPATQSSTADCGGLSELQHEAAATNCYISVFDNAAQAISWLRDQQELELMLADGFKPSCQA